MQSSWIETLQKLKDLHLKKFETKVRRFLIRRKKKMMRMKSLKRLLSNDRLNYFYDFTGETSTSPRSDFPSAYVWIDHNEEMECYHLLVKHSESRIGSPWFQSEVSLTRKEAFALLKKYRRLIMSKRKTFQEVARMLSASGAARFSEYLREFRNGIMRQRFVQIVRNLPIGGVAKPVGTPAGIHLIMRTR